MKDFKKYLSEDCSPQELDDISRQLLHATFANEERENLKKTLAEHYHIFSPQVEHRRDKRRLIYYFCVTVAASFLLFCSGYFLFNPLSKTAPAYKKNIAAATLKKETPDTSNEQCQYKPNSPKKPNPLVIETHSEQFTSDWKDQFYPTTHTTLPSQTDTPKLQKSNKAQQTAHKSTIPSLYHKNSAASIALSLVDTEAHTAPKWRKLNIPAQFIHSYQTFFTNFYDKITFGFKPSLVNHNAQFELLLLAPVEVISSKNPIFIGRSTAPITLLKPDFLESFNATSVDHGLDKIPGITMIENQASIRGGSGFSYGSGSRVLLLVNDLPALQGDAGFPNWDDVPMENIAQVEVLKGASSALYGSAALNGIINIRTADATTEPYTKASLFHTAYFSPKDRAKKWWSKANKPFSTGFNFAHRQKYNKLDVVLGTQGYKQKSYRKDYNKQYARIYTGLRYHIKPDFAIGVNANFNVGAGNSYLYWKDSKQNAYIGDSSVYFPRQYFRYMIDPHLHYQDKGGNKHKILSRFHHVLQNQGHTESEINSRQFYGEYRFQKIAKDKNFTFTAGAAWKYNNVHARLYSKSNFKRNNLAIFLQTDKTFFKKLRLSAGIRQECNSLQNHEIIVRKDQNTAIDTIPATKLREAKPVVRLGLNYTLAPNTFLRASWGQGYRYPTIAEKFIDANLMFLKLFPNTDLKSETSHTTDIGLKQRLILDKWVGFLDVSLFWSNYKNMIEFGATKYNNELSNIGLHSYNIGSATIKGIDLSISGAGELFGIKVDVLAGYTFLTPKYKQFDESAFRELPFSNLRSASRLTAASSSTNYNILKYRHRHAFKFDLSGTYRNLSLGISGFHYSHMENIDEVFNLIINDLETYRAENNAGFNVFDFRIGYQFKEQTHISLICKNIFNKEYTIRPALLEAPRNMSFRVEQKF